MFKTEESQEDFYLVECADWQSIILSCSYAEAATIALKEVIEKLGKNTKLSLLMNIKKVNDSDDKIEFLHVPEVLTDLGHYKLAKDLSSLSSFFLDKGETLH